MAKSVVSLVQLAGIFQSIIINLIKRVEALGGEERDVRRLSNSEDTMLQRVAEVIIFCSGRYCVPYRYKNWPAICLALSFHDQPDDWDPAVVWANALARPDTQYGRRLASAFPEFWSETEIQGPVPWSILQEEAEAEGQSAGSSCGKKMMVLFGAIKKFGLPYQEFVIPPVDSHLRRVGEGTVKALPDCIDPPTEVGKEVKWRGVKWIVVENRYGYGDDTLCIVPAECIAMDL